MLVKSKLVPSRSEGMRQCVNLAMPYFANLIDFLKRPLTEAEINNIRNFQEYIKDQKTKQLLLEKKDPTKRRQKAEQEISRKHEPSLPPLDNIYWKKMVQDGELINVPKEPKREELQGEEIQEVYVDGIGYMPTTRIVDFKNNNNKGGAEQ